MLLIFGGVVSGCGCGVSPAQQVLRVLRSILVGAGGGSGCGERGELVVGVGDDVGPGPGFGDFEGVSPGGAYEVSGDGEDAQPEPFGLGHGGPAGAGQALGEGGEVSGEGADFQPDLVVCGVVEGQVTQAGVFGGADAVLDAGVAAVPQFQVGELAAFGVGEEAGDTESVGVGEAELRAGVGAFLAQDQPGALRLGGQVDHAGDLGDPCSVAGFAVGVVGRRPRAGGDAGQY